MSDNALNTINKFSKVHLMRSLIFTLLALFTFSTLANAAEEEHFHYEIALHSQFNLEDDQLKSIHMVWLYDNVISDMMLENEKDLQSFADYLIKDLEGVKYFSKFIFDDKPLEIKKATNGTIKVIKEGGEEEIQQVQLSFDLPLKKAIKMSGKHTLKIINTDDSGSAIIFYKDETSLTMDKALKKHCTPYVKDKKNFEHGESTQIVELRCN